ncbi:hypothetical protein BLL52_4249 [Rhodoferax antarcticus ANT.BR]|uniref:Uncharacterized protein n=1 Tax=Rhodoferax antarcticus ANT.BR TaxID=1111071 RepID=A0A1Q8Y9A8_9BURK|nr:hypothetical protein BLL52_4249 [Rhodoferax antarcticus ANT.BR]
MLNSIDTYVEYGRSTAKARNQRGEARASFHKSWFSRAKALEQESDRQAVQQAFDDGYKDARSVIAVDRFA